MIANILENIDYDSRIIVMCELANIKHKYNNVEKLNAFRKVRRIFETMDFDKITKPQRQLFTICEDNIINLRNKLGPDALISISEADTANTSGRREEEQQDKQKEDDQEKIQADNQEEFRKESEKRKKSEQAPLAKAIRSKGENQDAAADKLDVDKSTISRIKTGERKPSFELMQKLKNSYGAGVVNQMLGT